MATIITSTTYRFGKHLGEAVSVDNQYPIGANTINSYSPAVERKRMRRSLKFDNQERQKKVESLKERAQNGQPLFDTCD